MLYIKARFLILLEIPKGSKEIDNVYAVNEYGDVLWKIQNVLDAFNIKQNTPYISLDFQDNDIVVTNFYGLKYHLDIINGYLFNKECNNW